MIKPIVNENKVVFGPCRLSYTHLFEKYAMEGDQREGKYMTNVLIPKTEKETLKAFEAAVAAAKKMAVVSKWKGKEPKNLDLPVHDGDEKEHDEDGLYEDHVYLNAKCSTRPGIVDKHKSPIVDEDDVYSGMWAIVSVTFYGYDAAGKKGIACGLNNIMKYKDDDRLGGRSSADTDFADVELDSEDDEDL